MKATAEPPECTQAAAPTSGRAITAAFVSAAAIAALWVIGACIGAFLRWGSVADLGWDAIIEVLLASTPVLAGWVAFRLRARARPLSSALRHAAVVVLMAAVCSLWLLSVMNSNIPSR